MFEGVDVIVKLGDTLTVAIDVVVQVPEPDNTVYVVVVVGDTAIVPVAGGFIPALAVQTNGPELPLTTKLVDCPLQIVVLLGVIDVAPGTVNEIVAVAVVVHVPVPDKTV